ncbi:diaminopimelate decarboxylase [Micromonospora haikouensis]|uniref:Diaminopimelate decarboxylase n=1 Tax=Micromonospora haikouensis TaxID=686309 RepID=A0A1C4YMZ2_9ACTN|nr:Y4yA family PLP-dependent enzyme [Micromonospora haikouensis]SCF22109.1 diaminopimelate decarboxylase [Micromonospora haikouensis]
MPLYLSPRIDPTVQSVLDETTLMAQLSDALGSPLGVVLPQQLTGNVAAFRSIFSAHRLSGQIYFAHKANRSSALVRELAATDAGIDVASLAELQHALGAGFVPQRIMATGPKNEEFLWLAARSGITVSADSVGELATLATLVTKWSLPRVRVMARLSGFASTGAQLNSRRSRFGVSAAAASEVFDVIEKHADALDLVGVAFHLDTIGLPEKAVALEGCLVALDECRRRGLRPWSVDIGGGFGVDYLADGTQWEQYTSALTEAVLGRRAPLTWNGHGYGLRAEGGHVRGSLNLYPAHRPLSGPAYLDRLLRTTSPELRRPLGTLLLDNMYELHLEPGRALLDQCGLVLASVLEVRDEANGDTIVRLDCNARDVSLEEHGVLMDPVVVHRTTSAGPGPVGVYLFGNLCLEADLITRRKVFLPSRPRTGDLLAFVNTAGYLMDFSATQALRQPIGRKAALFRNDGAWRWCLDEQYWPVHHRAEAP